LLNKADSVYNAYISEASLLPIDK
jgi:hypothetical protein